ncbi:MAG: hypothetical protein IJV06_10690 [Bacteroidaceae bacterium]|nr:hypothetical protein [Bacteroidaceae bacterium]
MEQKKYDLDDMGWLIHRHQECLKNVWPALCMFIHMVKKEPGLYTFPLPGREEGYCFRRIDVARCDYDDRACLDVYLHMEFDWGRCSMGDYALMEGRKIAVMEDDINKIFLQDMQKAFFFMLEQYFMLKWERSDIFLNRFTIAIL